MSANAERSGTRSPAGPPALHPSAAIDATVLRDATARLIAFYLPQYHPIPENDAWWGKGFTEWTNVTRARPLYPGHRQPRLPADLGYYDLRVPEAREAQAALARAHGIEGFCYWHYWFGHGRRIIERPFDEVLASGEPRLPFCLAWANESWSGIWHGQPKSVLLEQTYPGREDEAAHFAQVLPALRDERCIRIDGKPLFVVFKPHGLPSADAFVTHWRELAHRAGLPGLFLVAISNIHADGVDRYHAPMLAPFDAVTLLTPHDYLEVESRSRSRWQRWAGRWRRRDLGSRLNRWTGHRLLRPQRHDYADVVRASLEDLPDDPRFLPGVLPNWDNTPRSAHRGVVYDGATPALFERYLAKAVGKLAGRPRNRSIIFLKAWNEWAEGNYVEPDSHHGHAYLEAIRRQLLPQD